MSGVCNCVQPHFPCSACGAGFTQWDRYGPAIPFIPVVTPTPAYPLVVLTPQQLEEIVRRVVREELGVKE